MTSTADVARQTVELNRKGDFDAAGRLWAEDVVSKEPMDGPMARVQGVEAVREKGAWWEANHEVHDVKVEGPWISGDQFVVRYTMDVTPKGGERMTLDEVGLYTVKDGRIVEESFLYADQG